MIVAGPMTCCGLGDVLATSSGQQLNVSLQTKRLFKASQVSVISVYLVLQTELLLFWDL